MPVTRNALIRYKTIDACLRNRRKKWTLEKLIERFPRPYMNSKASTRCRQENDTGRPANKRSDKLGYTAAIIVLEKNIIPTKTWDIA